MLGLYLCPLPVRAQARVRHYRICTAADGGLYLQKGRLFPSLEELLAYYQANWKLIQSPLLQPCVAQVGPTPPAPLLWESDGAESPTPACWVCPPRSRMSSSGAAGGRGELGEASAEGPRRRVWEELLTRPSAPGLEPQLWPDQLSRRGRVAIRFLWSPNDSPAGQ